MFVIVISLRGYSFLEEQFDCYGQAMDHLYGWQRVSGVSAELSWRDA